MAGDRAVTDVSATATDTTSELRRSFGWRMPTAVAGLASTFLVTVVAVRALDGRDAALFLSVLVALNIGPMIGRLGLGQNVLRLIPAQPDGASRRRIGGGHLLATLLLSVCTAPVVAVLAGAGASGRPGHLLVVCGTAALIVLETVRLTLSDVFAAHGLVRWSVAMTHHVRSVLVLPLGLVVVLVSSASSVLLLVEVYLAVSAALLAVGVVRARHLIAIRGAGAVSMMVRSVGTGAVLFATDLVAFAVGQGTVWAATAGLPAEAAAQYATAAVLALQITVVESLAAIAVLPAAARLWAAGQRERTVRILSAVSTLTTAATVVAVVVLIAAGPLVLRVAYGPELTGAYPMLVILAVAGLAKTSFGINIAVLVISGHAGRAAVTALVVLGMAIPAAWWAVTTQDARWLAVVAGGATVVLAVAQWCTAATVVRPAARPHADLRAAWRVLTSARGAGTAA